MALAVFLRSGLLHLAGDRVVLTRDEAAAVENTVELLHSATAEAERIRMDAEQRAAVIGRQAHERVVALERDAAARAALIPVLNSAQVLRDLQPVLVEIVVETMVRLATSIDRRQLLERAIGEVGRLVGQRTFAMLKVAPADLEHAREIVAQLVRSAELPATLNVRADPSVAAGECVLLSDSGKVTLGLSQQINALAHSVHAVLGEVLTRAAAGQETRAEAKVPTEQP